MNITDNNQQDVLPPRITVSAQYIKDLSFENPEAPYSLAPMNDIPQIDVALEVKFVKLDEENLYEVELNIETKTICENKEQNKVLTLFVVELKYAGIFKLINIPEEHHQFVLAVDCAAMIFPFARNIIASVTQNGGFQPLMIDPIDFGALYNKKMRETQN